VGAKVAVDGDVTATPSASPASGADSGAWTAGPISYTTYSKLKVGGKNVIWKAKCTFSFSGKSGNSPYSTTEDVTLTASTKKLNKSQHNVLVSGDSETGTQGNKLAVSASGKLTSA
jgi:hypothetical protein